MDLLAERAWRELYGSEPDRDLAIAYSAKFKGYNARITATRTRIVFSLSRKFDETGDEIRLGVMQHLLNKLRKTKIDTLEIQLYLKFLKNMTAYAETTRSDPLLNERFDKINAEYFDGFMMTPNLAWGQRSLRKLGHYEYGTDTIILSTVLQEDLEMLDYVLYHEMLHKKHKFTARAGGFTRSHTKQFRTDEKKFVLADGTDPEKRLNALLRRERRAGRSLPAPSGRRPKSFLKSLFDYF